MDAAERIQQLKKEKNAVILAHNYQPAEIQNVADYVGDSFGLSVQASKTEADIIIFCGVDFMAESAKVLNPGKTVVLPEVEARCPMSAMCDSEMLHLVKEKYPEAAVVAYVNTSAAVKAETDVCCTSSNAVKVVGALPNQQILFVPDCNLGRYVQRFHPDKDIIVWPGYCPTHDSITADEINQAKAEHPKAKVLVHPECRPEVIDMADKVASTEGILRFAHESDAKEFIIVTEAEMVYRLSKENPDKRFYSIATAVCPTMKMISLDKVVRSLETLEPKVELSPEIMEKARKPLERMIEIGRDN
ncbi:MAG: Quinolinate synthase A [Methanomassiliicoccales archaeon PtaU1.Bin124]|nr:MAG: Quinolinate synthase A [Methanomassiliicoccales archaeon PtaU1.Bin124]